MRELWYPPTGPATAGQSEASAGQEAGPASGGVVASYGCAELAQISDLKTIFFPLAWYQRLNPGL